MQADYEKWAQDATGYFATTFGLASNFALASARLFVALWSAGLAPRVSSGFRDPRQQKAMQAAWDAGQRQGLRARPADPGASKHCKETWLGNPAATAIDMPCNDDKAGAQIATRLNIGTGLAFDKSDPGHYYLLA